MGKFFIIKIRHKERITSMTNHKIIFGRILYISDEAIYCGRGHRIFKSTDNGSTWNIWIALPVRTWQKVVMTIPLLARLLRQTIHHLNISKNATIIIANKMSYVVHNDITQQIESLHGSRPMVICQTVDNIYYGEYRSNLDRTPVSVWKLNAAKSTWESVWSFKDVRHIHGVFHDPYTDSIWVTTGDNDSEAGIWRTDNNFITLQKIAGGSQQYRAVQLLFTQDYLYFGSDAPEEQNYIYRMSREGKNLEQLTPVGSSVFYGCKVGNSLFFSTAIEPSNTNSTSDAEIWRSDNGTEWYKFLGFKKDIWSMKYFQYGQVLFPSGENESEYLCFTPYATKHSGESFIVNIHNDHTINNIKNKEEEC